MKMSFQIKELNLVFLAGFLQNWTFKVYEASLGVRDEKIIAFCASVSSKSTLKNDWESLTDCINNNYLTNIESDFEHWNSYLLFVVEEEILKSDGLEFEIENDKFYMRKIVEHNVHNQLREKEIIDLLNNKILAGEIDLLPNSGFAQNTIKSIKKKPLLHYQVSLIDENISISNSKTAREQRKNWLEKELNRVENNEN